MKQNLIEIHEEMGKLYNKQVNVYNDSCKPPKV